jgi:hypothetical protein
MMGQFRTPIPLPRRVGTAILLVLGACELLLVLELALGSVDLTTAVILHGFALASLALFGVIVPAPDVSLFVLSFLLACSTGPLGFLICAIVNLAPSPGQSSSRTIQPWGQAFIGQARATRSEMLYRMVVDGRARILRDGNQNSFSTILKNGPINLQQAVLGRIGLSYHGDYRPLLDQALKSHEPSIRVHAAAVCVKLRNRTRDEFRAAQEAAQHCSDIGHITQVAQRLQTLSCSGFLDNSECHSARQTALALTRKVLQLQPDAAARRLMIALLNDLQQWEEIQRLADPHDAHDSRVPVLNSLMHLRRSRLLNAHLSSVHS